MLGHGIRRVLVVRGEVDVFLDCSRAVDVVLIGPDLVRPGPLVQVRRRGEVVESPVPDNSRLGEMRQRHGEEWCLHCVVRTTQETGAMWVWGDRTETAKDEDGQVSKPESTQEAQGDFVFYSRS